MSTKFGRHLAHVGQTYRHTQRDENNAPSDVRTNNSSNHNTTAYIYI